MIWALNLEINWSLNIAIHISKLCLQHIFLLLHACFQQWLRAWSSAVSGSISLGPIGRAWVTKLIYQPKTSTAQTLKNFTPGQPITAMKPMYRSHNSSTLGSLHKVLLRFNFTCSNEVRFNFACSNEVLCFVCKMFARLIFSLMFFSRIVVFFSFDFWTNSLPSTYIFSDAGHSLWSSF